MTEEEPKYKLVNGRPPAQQAVHKGLQFPTGDKMVRKRSYRRWCKRRGINPADPKSAVLFKLRKQTQKAYSEHCRLVNEHPTREEQR